MFSDWKEIFNINSEADFLRLSLRVFRFQYRNNEVYRQWVDLLGVDENQVKELDQIPFLPIESFKNHKVLSSPPNDSTIVFRSSGTTSSMASFHYVNEPRLYEESFLRGFRKFYGDPSQYCILALLPSYLERGDSSLVYMVDRLIGESGHPLSGFFLDNMAKLIPATEQLKSLGQKTLLIGVSYALLDLCGKVKLDDNFIVMETGGMKGRRKEMLKPELHAALRAGLGANQVHSEYGMTELLSQAYSKGEGLFQAPPWMRFFIREVTDPLSIRYDHKTGGINVIDLANLYSCAFIGTKDLGRLNADGSLELMGRYDNSDIRGCNLMLA